MTIIPRHVHRLGVAVMAAALLVSCSGDPEGPPPESPTDATGLSVEVASYDVAVGPDRRVIVGLVTSDNLLINFGTIQMSLEPADASSEGGPIRAPGRYVPVPGEGGKGGATPAAVPGSQARGVYEATDLEFSVAGTWDVSVVAEVEDRGRMTGTGALEVLAETVVPAPGERALSTENLTLASIDAPSGAIDSRAASGTGIPDPELHRRTVASALSDGKPILLIISTPVYCVSRFCGPVTDVVQGLAATYGGVADFIHIEVWRDFQNQVVNRGAAEWVLRDDTLNEPWLFLIGADGTIQRRWDNVFAVADVEAELEGLELGR